MDGVEQCRVGNDVIHYSLMEKIGSGAFGTVFYAKLTACPNEAKWSTELAVKWFTLKSDDPAEVESQFNLLMQEKLAKILMLEHEHVIRYLAAYLRPPENLGDVPTPIVLMEFANGGTLEKYITGQALTIAKVRLFTKQLLKGLIFLHHNQIVHTDIKSSNILIDRSVERGEVLKIADLDNPIILMSNVTRRLQVRELRGTVAYLSPELASKVSGSSEMVVGYKTDIWSLGCVVLEMITGAQLRVFEAADNPDEVMILDKDTNLNRLVIFISCGGRPKLDPTINDRDLRHLILGCHLVNEEVRLTADQLLFSQFVSPMPTFDISPLEPNERAQLFSSTTCGVKELEEGGLLQIGSFISDLYLDEYYLEMRRLLEIIKKIKRSKSLLIILVQPSDLESLFEGVQDKVAVLWVWSSHNWSSAILKTLQLPNLVGITFFFCEDISLRKGHWSGSPNLRVISFINSSIGDIEKNVFLEIPSLLHFGPFNRLPDYSLSISQTQSLSRFHLLEWKWMQSYLEANPYLIASRNSGDLWKIGSSTNDAKTNEILEFDVVNELMRRRVENSENVLKFQMEKFTRDEVAGILKVAPELNSDGSVSFILSGQLSGAKLILRNNWLWTIQLPCKINFFEEVVIRLMKSLEALVSLGKGHPWEVQLNLSDGFDEELVRILSKIKEDIVVLHIIGDRSSSCQAILQKVKLPRLLELQFSDCANLVLQKGCLNGLPNIRAINMERCQPVGIEKEVLLVIPRLQSLVFQNVAGIHPDVKMHFSFSHLAKLSDIFNVKSLDAVREFFSKNPSAAEPKGWGELWEFKANGYYYASWPRKSDEMIVSVLTSI